MSRDQVRIPSLHFLPNFGHFSILFRLFKKHVAAISDRVTHSMAYMEVTVGLATFIRRFQSELYETDISDVKLKHDFLIPSPKLDTKGVRVKIIGVED